MRDHPAFVDSQMCRWAAGVLALAAALSVAEVRPLRACVRACGVATESCCCAVRRHAWPFDNNSICIHTHTHAHSHTHNTHARTHARVHTHTHKHYPFDPALLRDQAFLQHATAVATGRTSLRGRACPVSRPLGACGCLLWRLVRRIPCCSSGCT